MSQTWRKFTLSLIATDELQQSQADRIFSDALSLLRANGINGGKLTNDAVSGHRDTADHGRIPPAVREHMMERAEMMRPPSLCYHCARFAEKGGTVGINHHEADRCANCGLGLEVTPC